jgi:hypothetical protein
MGKPIKELRKPQVAQVLCPSDGVTLAIPTTTIIRKSHSITTIIMGIRTVKEDRITEIRSVMSNKGQTKVQTNNTEETISKITIMKKMLTKIAIKGHKTPRT